MLLSQMFSVTNMTFDTTCKNKILAKISEFTVANCYEIMEYINKMCLLNNKPNEQMQFTILQYYNSAIIHLFLKVKGQRKYDTLFPQVYTYKFQVQ